MIIPPYIQIFIPKSIRRNQILKNMTKDYNINQDVALFKKQLKEEMDKRALFIRHSWSEGFMEGDIYHKRNGIINLKRHNVIFNDKNPRIRKKTNKTIKTFEKNFKNLLKKLSNEDL